VTDDDLSRDSGVQPGDELASSRPWRRLQPALLWRGKQRPWRRRRGGKKGLGFSPGGESRGRGASIEKGIRRGSSAARDEHAVLVLVQRRRRAASPLKQKGGI
jgi:hypothetical protein